MGAVYLARDDRRAGSARFVALKRMLSDHSHPAELRSMFADEAEIASRIRHPHVCSVIDFDASAPSPYLVMELVAGQTLARVHAELARSKNAISARQRAALAVRIVADAAEGLHAAHELTDARGRPLGVVHRDVSLDNVLVGYDGAVKVIDFGVVRANERKHRTQAGVLKGKFAYIAPEVLRGAPADRRADVWALGVALWELVTGERLFRRAGEIDTLRAVAKLEIQPPSKLCSELPAELDAIVLSALTRDPKRRCPSARELARALSHLAPIADTPVGLSDLAELTRRLFPNGKARHERLLRAAAELEDQETTRVWQPRERISSPAPRRAFVSPTVTFSGPQRRPVRARSRTLTVAAQPAVVRRGRGIRSRLALALAAAVVTATAVGAVYAHRGDDGVVQAR